MKHTSDLALENELAPLKHNHEMAIMMGVESSEEQGRFCREAFAVRLYIVQVTEGRCVQMPSLIMPQIHYITDHGENGIQR